MTEVKIRKIGNSLGVILPKEVLAQLRAAEGDSLMITAAPDGVFVSAYDARVAEQVEAGRGIARRYRNALRELAK
ncbi:MAG: AbrB/MazE/SpoVT family DNA-binding domain-containing protein [Hyphomonadaceae bacterium]|nr:AbrB/MazE/SpoVT family DNA-binding domain-containing protein [Hyphomonadaceae bacterium]